MPKTPHTPPEGDFAAFLKRTLPATPEKGGRHGADKAGLKPSKPKWQHAPLTRHLVPGKSRGR